MNGWIDANMNGKETIAREMLAALKMADCEMTTLKARVNEATRKNLEGAIGQIRLAIKKATGKA